MSPPARHPPVEPGRRYGKLVVLSELERDGNRNRRWLCRCDCGNQKSVRHDILRCGQTNSCGCSRRVDLALPQPYNPADGDDPKTSRTLTVVLSPDDVALVRALGLVDGHAPGDLGGTLVRLAREAGVRRGMSHIVGRHDPSATLRAVQSFAQRKHKATAGADGRRRSRPTAAEQAAHRAGQIEAGA